MSFLPVRSTIASGCCSLQPKHSRAATVMLSTIWTATNLQFVFVLTRGGPASRTEIFPHLAYTTALGARRLGMGAAISLVFFPVLAILILLLTRRMLRPTDE